MANAHAKESANRPAEASAYLKEETALSKRLADAEQSERKGEHSKWEAAEKMRLQQAAAIEKELEHRALNDARATAGLHVRLTAQINDHERELSLLRQPREEKLRLLMLASSGAGDLRVGREQKRIFDAVRFASGRESIVLDLRPAVTGEDLLNGLAQGRPHIVHFSSHGTEAFVVFEQDTESQNHGAVVTADAFTSALRGVHEPPLLVVLHACLSTPQAERPAEKITSFAIGRSDSIADEDATA
ncbi:CHAT domain-containing protein [Salinibacterium amurskyense]|uniref:CHAT domain-containing protein n=1 Tax=Salinibacterium amurskyense TaxID=205941 RepID=UPI000C2381DE|nr:CHAT domain-containing protein [Salinibacterium amurskyense]RLQ83162.1 hypothetical protein D9C83_01535 [Salinibacterium amurskyense]GHD81501.1 hypothetical protein GCM10007394_14990 [Salinibacterium amurskyense]